MTPKDKAKDLIQKFSSFCWECDNDKDNALISVNELIDEVLDLDRLKYWNEVKKEIEKYETTSL